MKKQDDIKTDLVWHTEKRKVKDLKLFEGNPRKMTKEQAEQLIKSLKKFNLVEIPAIDQNNRVIAGNMRIQALKQLGREDEEIEVRVPNRPLTEEEAREYLLRSNKNVGEWDYDLLANFDEDLLKEVGFEEDIIAEVKGKEDIKFIDINALQETYSVIIKCKSEEEMKEVMEILKIPKKSVKYEEFIKIWKK